MFHPGTAHTCTSALNTHYPPLDHFSLLSSLSQPSSFSTPSTADLSRPFQMSTALQKHHHHGSGPPWLLPGQFYPDHKPLLVSSCPAWQIHLLHHPKVMISLRCPLPFMVSSHAQHFQYCTRCWPFVWQALGSSHHWQYIGITEKQFFTLSYLKTLIWKRGVINPYKRMNFCWLLMKNNMTLASHVSLLFHCLSSFPLAFCLKV